MISDFQNWWAFLTYDRFKSHVNVTEGFENTRLCVDLVEAPMVQGKKKGSLLSLLKATMRDH